MAVSAIRVAGRQGRRFAVGRQGGVAPTGRPGLLHLPASGRLPREAAGAGLYRRECGDGAAKRRLRGFAVTIPDAGKEAQEASKRPAAAAAVAALLEDEALKLLGYIPVDIEPITAKEPNSG